MERHTKHRILGVLVVIGLVVIMLPFFQTKNELPSETALVKTPPFPDQAADTAKNEPLPAGQTSAVSAEPVDTIESAEAAEPTDAISANPIPLSVTTAPMVTPVPDGAVTPKAQELSAAKPEDTSVNAAPIAENVSETPTKYNPDSMTEAKQEIAKNDTPATVQATEQVADATAPAATQELAKNDAPAPTEKVAEVAETVLPAGSERDMADIYDKPAKTSAIQHVKIAKAVHSKIASKLKSKTHAKPRNDKHVIDGYQVLEPDEVASVSASKNKFAKLKSANWAVQLGSFKNKSNAIRLVNLLRSRGYHSFMEEASSSKNGLTKVLVGPEIKKDGAHTLASKLENEVHIRGMVINYKPLAL
jgi:DedD protein